MYNNYRKYLLAKKVFGLNNHAAKESFHLNIRNVFSQYIFLSNTLFLQMREYPNAQELQSLKKFGVFQSFKIIK